MSYQNILVQALFNIGDVVLATSAVALLKKAYPNAKVTVMVRPAAREIVENNPVVDQVLVVEYQSKHCSLSNTIKLIMDIRSRKFDLSISLDAKLRSILPVFLAGVPIRLVADNIFKITSFRKKLCTHVITPLCDVNNSHQSEIFQSVIRQFTNVKGSARPVMSNIEPVNKEKARRLINSLPQHRYKVALCVKGTFPLKDWGQAKFAALINELNSTYDCSFFIIGAPGDRSYADEIIEKTSVPVANFCGLTNLVDLAALLDLSDLFITVDTGATHIASTRNIPIVAIYGCTSPVRWHPLNERYVIVHSGLKCVPCSITADACPEHACMNSITVDKVLKAVEDLNCLAKYGR